MPTALGGIGHNQSQALYSQDRYLQQRGGGPPQTCHFPCWPQRHTGNGHPWPAAPLGASCSRGPPPDPADGGTPLRGRPDGAHLLASECGRHWDLRDRFGLHFQPFSTKTQTFHIDVLYMEIGILALGQVHLWGSVCRGLSEYTEHAVRSCVQWLIWALMSQTKPDLELYKHSFRKSKW